MAIPQARDADGLNDEYAMRRFLAFPAISLALLSACSHKPRIVTALPPPPVPAPLQPTMPAGAYVGMRTPPRMSDGRYLTPNRNLSADGTVWHLRAALNVAALACRGADEDRIVASYNALLTRQKALLQTAQARLSAEYKAQGGAWQDRYDDQMTRLYNFFSQSQVREPFCRAAAATLADSATSTPATFPSFASDRLPVLEKPFTDFFAAYDAWRAASVPANRMASMGGAPGASASGGGQTGSAMVATAARRGK
ncbi:hypothetical protein [Sphingomonas echinoides]|uniref:hypothetical protein n=1 Tax=Sphingomonas echinoides TaxID=59803 RepID=UPI0024133FFB|nr:hypothetical protein [Sphingomonas echinoides]